MVSCECKSPMAPHLFHLAATRMLQKSKTDCASFFCFDPMGAFCYPFLALLVLAWPDISLSPRLFLVQPCCFPSSLTTGPLFYQQTPFFRLLTHLILVPSVCVTPGKDILHTQSTLNFLFVCI